jgi:hypothetical protein
MMNNEYIGDIDELLDARMTFTSCKDSGSCAKKRHQTEELLL